MLLSFTMAACDKIYDNDKIEPQPAVGQSYQNINCTDYAKWVYINLHNGDSITLSYEQATLPDAWDIALHRYDVKTNGGKAVETSFGSLDELKAAVDGALDGSIQGTNRRYVAHDGGLSRALGICHKSCVVSLARCRFEFYATHLYTVGQGLSAAVA